VRQRHHSTQGKACESRGFGREGDRTGRWAQIDQEKTRLDEVKKVVVDFKPLYHTLDRKSRLEVVHRFPRRIDSADTNVVVHWRFSQSDCQVPRLEVGPRMGVRGERGRVL
jgi:hypothetical protein